MPTPMIARAPGPGDTQDPPVRVPVAPPVAAPYNTVFTDDEVTEADLLHFSRTVG